MSMIQKVKHLGYVVIVEEVMRVFAPPKVFLKTVFRHRLKYPLNLKSPKTFNEKIQWIKLYDRNPLYTMCSDKLLVRQYVSERIGSSYLNQLIKVFDKPDDIDTSDLPEKFVLKLNTGAGKNYICANKRTIDIKDIRRKFSKWYKEEYYKKSREYHYKGIKKQIICEAFLDADGEPFYDYKVFCFNGEPYLIMVVLGDKKNDRRNLYNKDWSRHSGYITHEQDDEEVEKPECLNELLECARKLSRGFKEVRADFYIVHNKVYFGELTFTSGSGFSKFSSYEFDLEMGNMFSIGE